MAEILSGRRRATLAMHLCALVLFGLLDPAASLFTTCSGHGTFSALPDKTFGCLCDPDWTGIECATAVCAEGCQNGRCALPGVCQCDAGWHGPRCDEQFCPNMCSSHGVCHNGTCACDMLHTGPTCSAPRCTADCSGHGTCRGNNTCECYLGYRGFTWFFYDRHAHRRVNKRRSA